VVACAAWCVGGGGGRESGESYWTVATAVGPPLELVCVMKWRKVLPWGEICKIRLPAGGGHVGDAKAERRTSGSGLGGGGLCVWKVCGVREFARAISALCSGCDISRVV